MFLEDCAFGGWSIIQDGTFLHFVAPDVLSGGGRVLAAHIGRDGRIDLASSGYGVRAYGEWPSSAWLQTMTDAATGKREFSRWNGTAWALDRGIAPSVESLMPWRDHNLLRVERNGSHGTRLLVQNDPRHSTELHAPPDISRFDVTETLTLPSAGIAVMLGALEDHSGYAIAAGSVTAVLRNTVGSSTGTVSPECGRILLSQWIDGTVQDPTPRIRAVRIREGTVEPGEDLPAEPAHFAIDRRCHEWLVSADGQLFERASPATGWQSIILSPEGSQSGSTAIAVLGDRVWVAIGTTLYVAQGGKADKVALPLDLGANGGSFFLASDEQAERLWAAVIPVNQKRGTILTTGPAPERMRCDELARRITQK